MNSEKQITFKSYEHTAYKRKNIAILRSIFSEIESYILSGCTWEDIFETLKAEPYNLDMTLGSFHNAIYRIRSDLKKTSENRLSSVKAGSLTPRSDVSSKANAGGGTLLKGTKIFKTLNEDAKRFKRNPNPDLDELLKGNTDD